MKGKEIITFLKGLDECQEKTDGKVIAYNNLELIAKYKEKTRRAFDGRK